MNINDAYNNVVAVVRGKAVMTGAEHEVVQASLRFVGQTLEAQSNEIERLKAEVEVLKNAEVPTDESATAQP